MWKSQQIDNWKSKDNKYIDDWLTDCLINKIKMIENYDQLINISYIVGATSIIQ